MIYDATIGILLLFIILEEEPSFACFVLPSQTSFFDNMNMMTRTFFHVSSFCPIKSYLKYLFVLSLHNGPHINRFADTYRPKRITLACFTASWQNLPRRLYLE